MKRNWRMLFALFFALIFCTVSAAESSLTGNPDARETPVQTQTVPEEEEASQNRFQNWLSEGGDLFSEMIQNGWNEAKDLIQTGLEAAGEAVEPYWKEAVDAVGTGFEWVKEQIREWIERIEAFLKEKGWDAKIQEAWNTLKEGVMHTGGSAADTLREAYRTVREWIVGKSEQADAELTEAVDMIAGAAGVTEARLSSWYRQMSAYVTEHADRMPESVKEAWALIGQNASQIGSVAEEDLQAAYDEVHSWVLTLEAEELTAPETENPEEGE